MSAHASNEGSPDRHLVRITDSVWLWPSHPDPALVQASVGIITGDAGSVIVDAGQSPDLARQIQSAMESEGAEAAKPWSHEYLRAEMERDPLLRPSYEARARAMEDFARWHVVLPEQTFTKRLALDDGLELEHVGGRHTPESTIVRIPRDGVIFLGDCYYPPPYHLRGPEDGLDLDLLKSIVSNDYEWYVESHAPPWRRADIG